MASSKIPARRYTVRVTIAMTIYLVSLFTGRYLVERGMVDGPAVWVLALVPGLAVTGVFYAIGKLIVETTDEFMRLLLVRQSLIATAFALSITTVWGFLENFGLVQHVEAYWVAFVWFGGLFVGMLVNKLTLGTAGIQCP